MNSYNNPTRNMAQKVQTGYSVQSHQARQFPEQQLPTGVPTGQAPVNIPQTPNLPGGTVAPGEQAPQTIMSTAYTPGFLRTQIGRMVRVEFLIGTSTTDRLGTLVGVGASYILFRPIGTSDVLLCDIYSIKFVTVYSRSLE